MSKNRNADQWVQLSHCLSDTFLLRANQPLRQRRSTQKQTGWEIKALKSCLQTLLQSGQRKLREIQCWLRNLVEHPALPTSRQPCSDSWTTDALIQMSEAKASAFFVDCK
jgi:hypothetical protein